MVVVGYVGYGSISSQVKHNSAAVKKTLSLRVSRGIVVWPHSGLTIVSMVSLQVIVYPLHDLRRNENPHVTSFFWDCVTTAFSISLIFDEAVMPA